MDKNEAGLQSAYFTKKNVFKHQKADNNFLENHCCYSDIIPIKRHGCGGSASKQAFNEFDLFSLENSRPNWGKKRSAFGFFLMQHFFDCHAHSVHFCRVAAIKTLNFVYFSIAQFKNCISMRGGRNLRRIVCLNALKFCSQKCERFVKQTWQSDIFCTM